MIKEDICKSTISIDTDKYVQTQMHTATQHAHTHTFTQHTLTHTLSMHIHTCKLSLKA